MASSEQSPREGSKPNVEAVRLTGVEIRSEQVQRRPDSHDLRRQALPQAWLVDFDGVVSDQVDRLAADNRLYRTLAAAGFRGPGWDRFSDALARYGLQVLRAWIGTGAIFVRCRQRGYRTERRIQLQEDEVIELASMTVAQAIATFRHSVLPKGRWDPEKGASLRTFFIGQCLMKFPRVYATWIRDNPRFELVPEFVDQSVADPSSDPAHLVEIRSLLADAIGSNSQERTLVKVLALLTTGHTQYEIAAQLDMTVGAVESLLFRHRRKVGA